MANGKRRISLKDLAQELGVSIATVSRALRSSPEIGQEMQERVKELARRLNYRPNPFAQSLRKEAPRVIGVVLPNLVTHYYAAVLDGIEEEAAKSGYSVISANTHEQSDAEVKAIDNFISLHVEGIVACPSSPRLTPSWRWTRLRDSSRSARRAMRERSEEGWRRTGYWIASAVPAWTPRSIRSLP